jgi:hypothetical protein
MSVVLNGGAQTIDNDRHDRVRPGVPLRCGYTRQRAQEKNNVGCINLFAHLTTRIPPPRFCAAQPAARRSDLTRNAAW